MQDTPNPKKLFVGNLPFSMTDQELKDLFGEYGEVASATIIINKLNGRSKGFGFVEFTTEEAAQAAEQAMNGFEYSGRNLVVNVARPPRPREDRPQGGYNRGGGYGRDNRGGGYDRRNSY